MDYRGNSIDLLLLGRLDRNPNNRNNKRRCLVRVDYKWENLNHHNPEGNAESKGRKPVVCLFCR